MADEKKRIRHVVPVNFDPKTIELLKVEAKELKLKTATYIRKLIKSHPYRKKD